MANNEQQTRNHPSYVEPARDQHGNGGVQEATNRKRTANNPSPSMRAKLLETSTKRSSTSNESASKDQNSDSDESERVKEKTDGSTIYADGSFLKSSKAGGAKQVETKLSKEMPQAHPRERQKFTQDTCFYHKG